MVVNDSFQVAAGAASAYPTGNTGRFLGSISITRFAADWYGPVASGGIHSGTGLQQHGYLNRLQQLINADAALYSGKRYCRGARKAAAQVD